MTNGLDVNCNDHQSKSLLECAIDIHDQATVRFLILRGANINAPVIFPNLKRPTTLIHVAVHNNDPDNLTYLLEVRADVNAKDWSKHTALKWLALSGGDMKNALKCCELLIEHGINVHIASNTTLASLNYDLGIAATYIISAGGDSWYNEYSKYSKHQISFSLGLIPTHIQLPFLKFLFESGFHVNMFVPSLQETNTDLASYINTELQNPLSMKRLAANVVRKALVPNAWVGMNRLPLPPGFDQQYIILNAKQLVSQWLENYYWANEFVFVIADDI